MFPERDERHNMAVHESPAVKRKRRPTGISSLSVGLFIFLTGSYFLSGKFGQRLAFLNPDVTALWAPAGISIAAFLLLGNRVWPAVFVGAFLVNLATTGSVTASLGIAVGNTAEGFVAAYLVNRYAGGRQAFQRPNTVIRFAILAGMCATAISATVGVSMLSIHGLAPWNEYGTLWLTWWIGDALGALIFASFLILLFGDSHHALGTVEFLEAVVLLSALSLVCVMVFGPHVWKIQNTDGLIFLCVPFLIWASFRFCPLEAAGTNMILFGFATWGSLHGYGPFAVSVDAPVRLGEFIGILGTMNLLIAAAVAKRRRGEGEMLQMLGGLQESSQRKIKELSELVASLRQIDLSSREDEEARMESARRFMQVAESSPEVIWLLDATTEETLYVSPAYESIWGRPRTSLYADPHSWVDALHPDDHVRAMELFRRDSPEDRVEAVYRIVRPDGGERWIHDRGFVIRDFLGRPARVLGLSSDVTERMCREELKPSTHSQSNR